MRPRGKNPEMVSFDRYCYHTENEDIILHNYNGAGIATLFDFMSSEDPGPCRDLVESARTVRGITFSMMKKQCVRELEHKEPHFFRLFESLHTEHAENRIHWTYEELSAKTRKKHPYMSNYVFREIWNSVVISLDNTDYGLFLKIHEKDVTRRCKILVKSARNHKQLNVRYDGVLAGIYEKFHEWCVDTEFEAQKYAIMEREP